jgi:hypothetical protein
MCFVAAGWTKADPVVAIVVIGDRTATNYLHAITRVPVYLRPHLTFRADWARPAPSNDGAESNSERSKPWTYPLS